MRLILLILFLVGSLLQSSQRPPSAEPSGPDPTIELSAKALESSQSAAEANFDTEDIVAASGWIQATGLTDWMGPLAPIALSPFFGVTCLSGLAIWGPSWISDNALLASSGPLRSEVIFFVFLVFTLLTSLPRFTKVSKPFAQAIDQVEAYAVIVILLVIKFASSIQTDAPEQLAMVQLGVFSFTLDMLIAIAMVINIVVINSVKFFFEFLCWLTPFPMIDAAFEIANKSVCAALMTIYAFSPSLATAINLVMLVCAAIVFRWIGRRVRFYRTMVLDPVLASAWQRYRTPEKAELVVFPQQSIGPFPARSRLTLHCDPAAPGSFVLSDGGWFLPRRQYTLPPNVQLLALRGWVMHRIAMQTTADQTVTLHFSRRYDETTLQSVLAELQIQSETQPQTDRRDWSAEFA